ncbi:MAG: Ig-like domain-containing protein [archaeon]
MKRGTLIVLISIILIILISIIFAFFTVKDLFFQEHIPLQLSPNLTVSNMITILNPANKIYYFNLSDDYTFDLEVSSEVNIANWWFTLMDTAHRRIVYNHTWFASNTTNASIDFDAVKWDNELIVYAVDPSGLIHNATVIFSVEVPNSAPKVYGIDDLIYACEGDSLEYPFFASDVDEEILNPSVLYSDPFFVRYDSKINSTTSKYYLFSKSLNKAHSSSNGKKLYEEVIFVDDKKYSDSIKTNITILEINNPPVIKEIGVQTVLTQGGSSRFYEKVRVTDVEDGDLSSLDFSFNISFHGATKLFDITNEGVIDFTADEGDTGNYTVTICATDSGIDNPDPRLLAECGQDGGHLSDCDTFSLVITEENKPPTITNWYPTESSLNINRTDTLYFNASVYDPSGIAPDTYWYVGGILQEVYRESFVSGFLYNPVCGGYGTKLIRAVVSDGLMNDSLEWVVNLGSEKCDSSSEGGISIINCKEIWGCADWSICQNAGESLRLGLLPREDYFNIKEECDFFDLDEGSCGMQVRSCIDVNSCNTTRNKPQEFQSCHYTIDPRCDDRIKNCHSGGCELLIDCGGSCSPCPTCSDEIQNQNEGGVDCGGPCSPCPVFKPLYKRRGIQYGSIVVLLLIIFTINKFLKVVRYQKEVEEER